MCVGLLSGSSGPDVLTIHSRSFYIPIRVAPAWREQIKDIRVFVSTDDGKRWRRVGKCKPKDEAGVTFVAPRDGLYWFAVQTVTRTDEKEPRYRQDLVPRQKVRVEFERRVLKPTTDTQVEREVEALRDRVERLERKLAELTAKGKKSK
jgi:hypothetical protein